MDVASSIGPDMMTRAAVGDGEPINVGVVNGLSRTNSIQPIWGTKHVPSSLSTNPSEGNAQSGIPY